MIDQEIFDFFKDLGVNRTIKITDFPMFNITYIDEIDKNNIEYKIKTAFIGSVDFNDNILKMINNLLYDVYVYRDQEFNKYMKTIRIYFNEQDIVKMIRHKLRTIKNKMIKNDNRIINGIEKIKYEKNCKGNKIKM